MTPLAAWCLARKMSMRLSCDLACARKIINLFIINANDSNCKETQTFPYCTASTQCQHSTEIISRLSLGSKYQLWLQSFTITIEDWWCDCPGLRSLYDLGYSQRIFSLRQVKLLSVKCSQPSVFICFKFSGPQS